MKNYTYSESFAGIGAWGKAIKRVTEKHGDTCELKWYAEIDKYASNSFSAIHEETEEKNIWDITKDIKVEPVDVFFYSPPCQTFSIAGKREGVGVEKGNLFYEAAKLIKQTNPKYAIMENVKGLSSGEMKKDFINMLEHLEGIGYFNYWKILNSKDYGIPQNRERIFIISIRKDLYDNGKRFEFPNKIDLKLTLDEISNDAINLEYMLTEEELKKVLFDSKDIGKIAYADFRYDEGLRIRKDNISPCLVSSTKPGDISGRPLKIISNTKQGYEIANSGDTINMEFAGSNTRRGRVDKKISQTLTTRSEMAIYNGYSVFKFSPLIFFRLQGFDDQDFYIARDKLYKDFGLSDKKIEREMYLRAGNSITVNVIEEILENLLYDRKQEKQQLMLF